MMMNRNKNETDGNKIDIEAEMDFFPAITCILYK